MGEIMAFGNRRTNAELIKDLADLGWLKKDDICLDATFGEGRWWTMWRPNVLIASDLYPIGDDVTQCDFTKMPWVDEAYDVVALDPPYKLSGTSNQGGPASSDAGYGIDYNSGCHGVLPRN